MIIGYMLVRVTFVQDLSVCCLCKHYCTESFATVPDTAKGVAESSSALYLPAHPLPIVSHAHVPQEDRLPPAPLLYSCGIQSDPDLLSEELRGDQ